MIYLLKKSTGKYAIPESTKPGEGAQETNFLEYLYITGKIKKFRRVSADE